MTNSEIRRLWVYAKNMSNFIPRMFELTEEFAPDITLLTKCSADNKAIEGIIGIDLKDNSPVPELTEGILESYEISIPQIPESAKFVEVWGMAMNNGEASGIIVMGNSQHGVSSQPFPFLLPSNMVMTGRIPILPDRKMVLSFGLTGFDLAKPNQVVLMFITGWF